MLAFIDLEERVPTVHPLRTIKRLADEALTDLSPTFDQMYAKDGRPSIPPERLLKASLLIALYSVRSERAFCEELEYNLLRDRRVTPHVARNTSKRRSAIDGRTTRHPGYAVSQKIRKRVEEVFGWMKTVGGFRRTRYRGLDRTGLAGYLVATAYNLVRLSRLALRQAKVPAAA
jgi:transposase